MPCKKIKNFKEIENSINFKDKQKSVDVNNVDESGKSSIARIKFIVDGGRMRLLVEISKKLKIKNLGEILCKLVFVATLIIIG